MFLEILISILVGLLFGVITGLIPGIHPNAIAVTLISLSPFLLLYTSPLILAIFIITVTISNTFIDTIPSCYLGAPEENTSLGVLPMHRLLLEGKGHEAILLTIMGSLFSLVLGIILIPLLIPTLKVIFPFLKKIIPYLLIFSSLFIILKEKNKFYAFITFFLAGILGLITLNFPNLPDPLFPLLSGLFGLSTLLLSLNSNTIIPKQTFTIPKLNKLALLKIIPTSIFSGGLVSTLPAMSSSQAAIIGTSLIKKIDTRNFLIMLGGINITNLILSFVSLYAIDKARNGTVVAISQIIQNISLKEFILFISICMFSAGIAAILTIYLSKIFAKLIQKISYQNLILSIAALILFLVLIISGFYGFLILLVATFIGMIPQLKNISKSHLMGCLMLPVILFYLL